MVINLDPLDPLTEIINSGQAFHSAIAVERIIWLIIGIFFLGAISKSISNGMRNQIQITKKSFFENVNPDKNKNKSSQ